MIRHHPDAPAPRLGYFTRLLDDVSARERYRNALAQFVRAEELGFDTAWVAQHHFHRDEGGLPSPFVFLAQAAARTSRLILGTSIVTLPLEEPLRVAEDAAVLSLLADGRFELGIGSGGTPSSFPPFGHDPADRPAIQQRHRATLLSALAGRILTSDDGALEPPAPASLRQTLWEATFSAEGASRIGADGHGIMLSRTQPRAEGQHSLSDVQEPIVAAHAAALPPGVRQRVFASRSVIVVGTRAQAEALRERTITRALRTALGPAPTASDPEELLRSLDVFLGTPDELIPRLREDRILATASDLVFQPHPADPSHQTVLRSLELIATEIAPALGWTPASSPSLEGVSR